jgi:nitrite reductase/ring-hydroxylating ferredoxin subunit
VTPAPAAAAPAPAAAAEDELTVALADLPERVAHPLTVGRKPVLVFRDGDRVYAVAGRCTHQGVELAGGALTGALLRCPWHGATFDLRTGARLTPPSCRDLRAYQVRVAGDRAVITTRRAEESR